MGAPRRRRTNVKFARQVVQLRDEGYTFPEIGAKLHASRSTLARVMADYRNGAQAQVIEIPMPKDRKALPDEVAITIGDSADAFEMFYNRYNTEYKLPFHMKWLVEQALRRKRKVINVPPGHGKSSIFSIWFPIWRVCQNPDVQIILISKTAQLAIAFARAIANELETNDKLIQDFGRFKPLSEGGLWQPGTGKLEVEGRNRSMAHGATIESRGAGQQVYGFRADHIIADDIADIETCRTEDRRKNLSDWFHMILNSRLRPGATMTVIGTRFHPQDIYGELAAKKVTRGEEAEPLYEHVNFPALRDPDTGAPTSDWENGKALWPRVWPKDKLREEIFDVVGSIVWNQTYQQIPLAAEDALVIPEWVYGTGGHKGCVDDDRFIGVGSPSPTTVRVLSIDPSPSKYCAMVMADITQMENGKHEITVIDLVRHLAAGEREMFQDIEHLLSSHGAIRYLVFEANQFARWFIQDETLISWAAQRSIRVIGHQTGRNKRDPEMGVTSLSAEFEFGRIRLPYADIQAKETSNLLIREATEYSLSAGKGSTDDLIMALWFIHANRHRLIPRKGNGLFKNGFKLSPRLKDGFGFQHRTRVPA